MKVPKIIIEGVELTVEQAFAVYMAVVGASLSANPKLEDNLQDTRIQALGQILALLNTRNNG